MSGSIPVPPRPSNSNGYVHSRSTRHIEGLDGLIAAHCDIVQRDPSVIADPESQRIAAAYHARRAARLNPTGD